MASSRSWVRGGGFAAVLVALLLAGGVEAPRAAAATVQVGNNFFSPTFTSIRSGRVVTWVWAGGRRHNVTGMTRTGRVVFASRTTSRAGFSYSHRFRRSASFRVICTVHPRAMRMTVRVR